MSEDRMQVVEARRLINLLVRACRQTQTYFDGISVMDKNRVQRLLRDAIRESEKFLSSGGA
ncbi:MAG: hypothetical protein K8T26_09005 [Lentisphaerae bacterium]|nr:hypothetical protein [Lentisphaerota bacterium]